MAIKSYGLTFLRNLRSPSWTNVLTRPGESNDPKTVFQSLDAYQKFMKRKRTCEEHIIGETPAKKAKILESNTVSNLFINIVFDVFFRYFSRSS